MTKSSRQAEPKQLNRLQREVLDTLCIENREIKRSAALTRCVSETLSNLARAGVDDSRELTRMALHVGRKFSKEFGPSDERDNLSPCC
jgi:hypothetical protein